MSPRGTLGPRGLGFMFFLGGVLVSTSAMAFCGASTCNEGKTTCRKDAKGCVIEGNPVAWKSSTIEYRFHDKGTRVMLLEESRSAVRAAFSRWSDTLCPLGGRTRLRFVEGKEITVDPPANDGDPNETRALNGIFFRDDGWPHRGGSNATDKALATTFRLYGDKSTPGRITSARLEINTSNQTFYLPDGAETKVDHANAVDLITVVTHEVGHYIGIGHSREKDAIMGEALCEDPYRCSIGRQASRRLAPDDIAAVCSLYPPGEPDPPPDGRVEGPARDGCALGPRSVTSSAWPVGLFALGAILVFRRRALRG